MTPLRTFPIVTHTDRDFEMPLLAEHLQRHGPFGAVLDVGAYWSAHFYGPTLRAATDIHHGVDILAPDPDTAALVDVYTVGNACEVTFPHRYDLVTCCSVIEHAGVSTYKRTDVAAEQDRLFARCVELSRRHVWVSVPLGLPYVVPGELSVITGAQVARWQAHAEAQGATVRLRFGFNERGPQAGTAWVEHDDPGFAASVQYVDAVGNQSICVLEIDKGAS